jgi:hypothetical protein
MELFEAIFAKTLWKPNRDHRTLRNSRHSRAIAKRSRNRLIPRLFYSAPPLLKIEMHTVKEHIGRNEYGAVSTEPNLGHIVTDTDFQTIGAVLFCEPSGYIVFSGRHL